MTEEIRQALITAVRAAMADRTGTIHLQARDVRACVNETIAICSMKVTA